MNTTETKMEGIYLTGYTLKDKNQYNIIEINARFIYLLQ